MTNLSRRSKRQTVLIFLATAMVIFVTATYSFGLLTNQNLMNASGIIANVNTGVYSDQACTQNKTSITWGVCYPGDNKTTTVYIKNLGTANTTLTIQTSNWTPSLASTYLTLTSNYARQTLTAGQVLPITFTLKVSKAITGISSFSFNIVIISSG